jgi:hypothetical protein
LPGTTPRRLRRIMHRRSRLAGKFRRLPAMMPQVVQAMGDADPATIILTPPIGPSPCLEAA